MTAKDDNLEAFGKILVDILTKVRDYNRTQFQTERLRSYYLDQPAAAAPSYRSLDEARSVMSLSPSSACVLATTSTELTLKEALLRPLIAGLVHHEALAEHVTSLALAHTTFSRFDSLLVEIIREFAGLEMKPSVGLRKDPLWKAIQQDRDVRNRVVHEGVPATMAQAEHAIATAQAVLETVLTRVLARLGLTTNPDGPISAVLSVDEMLIADQAQAE
jgi:hypothetical protein